MESLLAALVLAISTNIDNFALGAACGSSRWSLRGSANLAIALCSGMSTFGAIQLGDWLTGVVSWAAAPQVGGGLLVAFGAIACWVGRQPSESGLPGWTGAEGMIGWRGGLVLGLLLALTNLGTGVAAGMVHLDPWLTGLCSALSSLATIGGGLAVGGWARSRLERWRPQWLAGLLLLGLGVWETLS